MEKNYDRKPDENRAIRLLEVNRIKKIYNDIYLCSSLET